MPKTVTDENTWKKVVKSTFYLGGQYEIKDVITTYNKLVKVKQDIYGKYSKKNNNQQST